MRIALPDDLRKSEWHLWFAWHPIVLESEPRRQLVWLETVLRRRASSAGYPGPGWEWEYRECAQ